MPYIPKENRDLYKDAIKKILDELEPDKVGELNYIITSIVWALFDANPSYTSANNLTGVLECVKQEFYRRKVMPYEEKKMKKNGDIL